MSQTAQALILDLDGTLIDSQPGILQSYRFAAQTVFPDKTFDPATVVIGPPLPRMFAASFPGASPEIIEKLTLTFREHYAREGFRGTVLYDGVEKTLRDFRAQGTQLYIATNKPLRLTKLILDYFSLAALFAEVVASDSVTPSYVNKAAMVRQLLEAHQLNAAHALYVGDSADDAEAAFECEVPFVWASYGYGRLPSSGKPPLRTIKSFSELEELTER
jgi:phosphoglycolate phosphatase